MSSHCPQHAMHAAFSPIRPRPPQRLLHHARLKYPPVEPATNGLRLQSDSTRPLTVLRMKLLLVPPVLRRPQTLKESITISFDLRNIGAFAQKPCRGALRELRWIGKPARQGQTQTRNNDYFEDLATSLLAYATHLCLSDMSIG